MKAGTISEEEFEAIRAKKLQGEITIWTMKGEPVFIRFADGVSADDMTNISASSKEWHIHAFDATWRFSANCGTSATEHATGGTGGVKVYTGVSFDDVTSVDYAGGSDWHIDEDYDYGGGRANLNYALTKGVGNPESDTFLFWFDSALMGSGENAYKAGSDFVFVIKDGTGGNHVKVQPVEISTDNPGEMSFTKRKYVFKYAMADDDGNF